MASSTCGHLCHYSFCCQKINCTPSGALGDLPCTKRLIMPSFCWQEGVGGVDRRSQFLPISADYKGFRLISKFTLANSIPLLVSFFDVSFHPLIFKNPYQSKIRKPLSRSPSCPTSGSSSHVCVFTSCEQYESPTPGGPHLDVNVCWQTKNIIFPDLRLFILSSASWGRKYISFLFIIQSLL